MNMNFKILCHEWHVNPDDLLQKVRNGLDGHDIQHFTDEELEVIECCLIMASE